MWRRALLYVVLGLLALALVVVPGVILIGGQTNWARQRVQEAIARGLADYLGREVAVGRVTGDLLDGFTVHGLAIAEGQVLRDGAVITADRVRVEYDLWSVLHGRLAPLASISAVHVYGPRVRVVHDVRGRLNLAQLLPPPQVVPPERRFRGRVFLHDGAVVYEDLGPSLAAPLVARATGLEVAVDCRQVVRIGVNASGRILDGRAGDFTAGMHFTLDRPFFNLDLALAGVDVAWLARHFRGAATAGFQSGRADVRGSLYTVRRRGKAKTGLSAALALHNLQISTKQPGLSTVALDGGVWLGQDGLRTDGLKATVAGSVYEVTGTASSLGAPVVDVTVKCGAARLQPFLQALPARARGKWALKQASPASLTALVIGPAGNPDVKLRLDMAGPLAVALDDFGSIRGSGLQLNAEAVSAGKQPSLRATVTAGRLEVPSLKLAATENPDLPRSVSVGPVRGLKVALQYAGGKPVGEATIVAPFVRAGDWSATDLSTHAVLLDDRLRLQNLRAQALGGKIAAEGLLLTKKPGDGVRLRGTARGLELARIPPLHGVDLPDDLTGSVDADFQARLTGRRLTAVASFEARGVRAEGVTADTATGTVGVEGEGTLSGVGRVTATGIEHETLRLDQAEALVRFEGQRLDVLSATAQSPLGTVWARGDVDLDGKTLALQVQGANLDLAPLAEPADLEDLGGRAYVSGDLTGAFDAPVFTGRLSVFDPRAGEYALSAATAQARYADKQLVLTDLLATQGSGILSGNVTLGNLQPGDSKHVTLAGRLVGEGLDLQEIVKLLKRDEPLSGLAEFDATLSGTVGQPQAAGHVRLANATYNDFVVTQADAPFTWADDRLAVSQGHATVLDAPVQVTGTLTLREPNELEAFLSAGDVPLEGLSPYLKSDLPIAGRASVERAWVRGPLKDLQGGARLTAQEVRVGDETIGDLNASLTLSRGQLQLQETSFALANGRVIVSGAYNTASEPQTVAAQVQLLQTEVPDLLQLAVPLASAADKRPAEERGRLLTTLRSYALRVKGAVDGTVNLSGPINAPAAAVDLAGEHLVLDGRTLPQIKTTARLTKDAVQDLVFAARQGDALINADGDIVFDGPINLNVEGTGIAMSLLRPWVPLQTSFGGQLGFTVVAEGLTREPEVMASVDIAAPSFAGVQFDVLSVPIATVREGQVDVDTLTVKRGETEIVLDGRLPFSWHLPGASGEHPGLIPDGQITMGGRIEKTPLAFFLPLVDEYTRGLHPPAPTPTAEEGFRWASLKTEGAVDSAVSLTGTVRTPTVRGYLKLDGGKVSPPKWTQAASDLNADLQFSGTGRTNLVEIKRLAGRYDQTQGELTGRVELTSVAPRDFWRNVMDLRLGLSADKQAVPGGSELSALHGALRLQTEDGVQVLRPEDLRLNVGGGEAELTGEARLRTFRVARLADNQFDLHFKMAPGRVRYQPYLDAMGHGNLDLVTPPGQSRARLTGNIQLTDGIIGLVAPAAGLDTFAAVSSALPSPDLDLIAGLGEGVQLRGSAVKAPLLPNDAAARITGTPQQPRLVGNVAAGRGTTMLPTSTLRLKSLFVDYVVEPLPGDRSDPQTLRLRGSLDGSAETTISRPGSSPVHINVRISGALPDHVTVTTTSEPPLTETQVYALLGGVPFAYLPGVGGGEAGLGQVLSEQFLAALGQVFVLRVFEPIEEQLQRTLGLELGITFAFNQPITLQVGKYLLRNLLVTYERPLVESSGDRFDLRVSYELPHGLRITYHNDERGINQVEVGYSFTF